ATAVTVEADLREPAAAKAASPRAGSTRSCATITLHADCRTRIICPGSYLASINLPFCIA
ncbi:MAG: hypothetical protein WD928_14710, partial [Gammaproteobacteria bacterium]